MQKLTDKERAALDELRGRASISEIARKSGMSMSRVAIYYGPRPRTWSLGGVKEASHG